MGNVSSMMTGLFSCTDNPAGLATIRSVSFGLYYRNLFGISELGTGGFACGIPARSGSFGIGYTNSGYKALTENKASFSYGRRIGNKFRAGIGIHWLMFNQPADYRDLYAWIPSLGIQWLPSEKVVAGITVTNPVAQEYIPAGYRKIPSGVIAGLGYKAGEELFVCIEAVKMKDEKLRYAVGIEWLPMNSLLFRFGFNREEFTNYSFGLGYRFRKISIDAAVERHPVLGFSPVIGISNSLTGKEQ